MKNEQLYTSAEVAVILELKQQSVAKYFRVHGIGSKDRFNNLLFTKKEIEQIRDTDGRRK